MHRKLDSIIAQLHDARRHEVVEMATIQEIQAKQNELLASVQAETNLVQAAKTLLEGQNAQLESLRQQLADALANGASAAAMQSVLDSMNAILAANEASKTDLANAVIANTPGQ